MNEEGLHSLLAHSQHRQYPAKTTIVREGARADALYYVVSGSVSVVTMDEEGREIVLAYLHAGDFFGEMGLFVVERSRSASVIARTACEVAQVNYVQFGELAHKNPSVVFTIAEQMALRLRKTNNKARDLAFLNVTGRVAQCLIDMSAEPEAEDDPRGKWVKVTRQEVGRVVGCSREMVSRVLSEIEADGLIHCEGKRILVLNH